MANYIACERLNFLWNPTDVVDFDHMWKEGLSISDIAAAFNRDCDEVTILAIDRAHSGHIRKRHGGAYGNKRSGRA